MKKVIVWFRQDLRLHDNEALAEALGVTDQVIPVYIFDPRFFDTQTAFGFPKITESRAQFILDSIEDLRSSLRQLGSELVVRHGAAEDEIFDIAREVKSSWVFCNRERTVEEARIQDALEQKLWTVGQEMRYSRGKMLYYTADLPFPVTHTPDSFTTFRKETERFIPIREPLETPSELLSITSGIVPGDIPSLEDLLGREVRHDFAPAIKGGESEGVRRLNELVEYLLEGGRVDDDADFDHASPWLSQGCLSPKRLYHTLTANLDPGDPRLGAILSGLYYRDYLRLMVKKYGHDIFESGGITGEIVEERQADVDRMRIWTEGITGIPIIDASMRQLASTGFISYRLRNLVSQFLIQELNVPWRYGASFFESRLIDYDPCSNWTNWCNLAGYGPHSKELRSCNYILQAKRIDPLGDYVKSWIPALNGVDPQLIHHPDQIELSSLSSMGVILGKDYPRPVFPTERWLNVN